MVSLGLLRSPLGGTMSGQQRVNTHCDTPSFLFLTLTDVSSICETHVTCYLYLYYTRATTPLLMYISTISVKPPDDTRLALALLLSTTLIGIVIPQ